MNPQENNPEINPASNPGTTDMSGTTNSAPVMSTATTQTARPLFQEPEVKIGKFKASRMIVKESWAVLKQDKELAWFPVISAICSLIALIVMLAIFFFVAMSGSLDGLENMSEAGLDAIGYVALFVYYVVMFTITNYFLAAMYVIINGRFNGQDLTFSNGISAANANFGKILSWSLISATVGVVLRIISDKSALIGKIVAGLFGAAWAILTYFSLPSLIIGQTTVKGSFKESASLIRKTWGETIIVNFGVGLFFMLLIFAGIALSIGTIVIVPVMEVAILVGILFVIYMVALSIISTTLSSIFKLAIFQYARTGVVPAGFTSSLIAGAVKPGKSK